MLPFLYTSYRIKELSKFVFIVKKCFEENNKNASKWENISSYLKKDFFSVFTVVLASQGSKCTYNVRWEQYKFLEQCNADDKIQFVCFYKEAKSERYASQAVLNSVIFRIHVEYFLLADFIATENAISGSLIREL